MKKKITISNKTLTLICLMLGIIITTIVVCSIYKVANLELMEVGEVYIKRIEDDFDDTNNVKTTIPKEDYIKMRQEEIENLRFVKDDMLRFIKLKGIYIRYQDITGISDNITEKLHSKFSLDEIYLMQRVIETECYQCDFKSKVNVASVILNRLDSGDFGGNIEDIVTNENQFAYGRRYITYDTVLALEYASYFGDTTNGALYFHSNKKTDRFNGKSHIFTDDAGHHFYG